MPSTVEDYEVLETIGVGTSGICKKIRRKCDGKLLAWKEIDYGYMNEEEKKLLVSEVNLLKDFCHPHIVHYHDRIVDKKNHRLYIVTEWCERGDLQTLLVKCRSSGTFLEEGFIWKVLHQVCLGLQACSGQAILHRDLKPANIFLDAEGRVKIGDFGLATVLSHENFAYTFVGTPFYTSPELVQGKAYDGKSDIWALGCLIYELCTHSPPFTALSQNQLAYRIRQGRCRRIPHHYSDDLQWMITWMLTVEDDLRPTVEMILHHPSLLDCTSSSLSLEENIQERKLQEKLRHLQKKEQVLREKEQELTRREKKVLAMERSVKEKLAKPSRPVSCNHRKMLDISGDTSCSADPGDTSLVPTSTWLDPSRMRNPFPKKKQVHFGAASVYPEGKENQTEITAFRKERERNENVLMRKLRELKFNTLK